MCDSIGTNEPITRAASGVRRRMTFVIPVCNAAWADWDDWSGAGDKTGY